MTELKCGFKTNIDAKKEMLHEGNYRFIVKEINE